MGNQEICFGHVLKPWVAISSQFLSITAGIDEFAPPKILNLVLLQATKAEPAEILKSA
jgi:hypothetical protein